MNPTSFFSDHNATVRFHFSCVQFSPVAIESTSLWTTEVYLLLQIEASSRDQSTAVTGGFTRLPCASVVWRRLLVLSDLFSLGESSVMNVSVDYVQSGVWSCFSSMMRNHLHFELKSRVESKPKLIKSCLFRISNLFSLWPNSALRRWILMAGRRRRGDYIRARRVEAHKGERPGGVSGRRTRGFRTPRRRGSRASAPDGLSVHARRRFSVLDATTAAVGRCAFDEPCCDRWEVEHTTTRAWRTKLELAPSYQLFSNAIKMGRKAVIYFAERVWSDWNEVFIPL